MKKILICCLITLGAFATQSFNVSNHDEMKPLLPNVPYNMYTEGKHPTPWDFPGHNDNEALMAIINNTSCKITLNQWFAWKNIIGDDFEENFKSISISRKSKESISYGDEVRHAF